MEPEQTPADPNEPGVWRVINGTGCKCQCQATKALAADVCPRKTLQKEEKRIIVWGKRKIGRKWVEHKFAFHLDYRCVNQLFDTTQFQWMRRPTKIYVSEGVEVTADEEAASGLRFERW